MAAVSCRVRARRALLFVAVVGGWVGCMAQWYRGEQLQRRLDELQLSQTTWRMRAAQAYATLLQMRGASSGTTFVVLPDGATMDCGDSPAGGKHCDPTTVFPPDD